MAVQPEEARAGRPVHPASGLRAGESQLPGFLLGPVPRSQATPRRPGAGTKATTLAPSTNQSSGGGEDPYHVTKATQVAADLPGA